MRWGRLAMRSRIRVCRHRPPHVGIQLVKGFYNRLAENQRLTRRVRHIATRVVPSRRLLA